MAVSGKEDGQEEVGRGRSSIFGWIGVWLRSQGENTQQAVVAAGRGLGANLCGDAV